MRNFFKYISACKKDEQRLLGVHPDAINLLGDIIVILVLAVLFGDFWLGVKVGLVLDGIFFVIGTAWEYQIGKKLVEGENG